VAPAMIHYDAVLAIFRYLSATKHHGITYTRVVPINSLPSSPPPTRSAFPSDANNDHDIKALYDSLFGYADSDWAMDIRHRRSISGIIMMLAGGAIAWLCRVQITISLSTTESEILSASDAGRLALYLRSVLAELGHPQHNATVIFEDNRSTVLISQASHPTRQTRHIDIREFALLDWNERDLIMLEPIDTSMNASDMLTKQCPKVLFARHYDITSGKTFYYSSYHTSSLSASNQSDAGSVGGCQSTSV
jgi:hypothetical protein